MTNIEYIKDKIFNLYKTNPKVHVNICMTNPKVNIKNDIAIIRGAYKNIFQIEETSSGFAKTHTFQYKDVLTKRIEIVELDLK